MKKSVFIYGAGGHAREVAWLIDSSADMNLKILGFVNDSVVKGTHWPDHRPVMTLAEARKCCPEAEFIIAIGDGSIRRTIAERLVNESVSTPCLVHSSVSVSDRVSLSEGCVICSRCFLSVDISIGAHVHVNAGCAIHHDVVIGEFTTLSPGALVGGNVLIGTGVFIGIGAKIISGDNGAPLVIGDGCVVAAGACVTRSTEPNSMVAGVPAVLKKRW